jgi:hypothetical protein
MLLSLQSVVDGSNATNLTIVITQTIFINKGISNLDFISKKVMSFGGDGVSIFEGCCIGVIIQFRYQFAPFMIGVHWMAHETNLVVQTFFILPMVNHLEMIMQ